MQVGQLGHRAEGCREVGDVFRGDGRYPAQTPRLFPTSHPASPLREDWSQHLNALPLERSDIWANTNDCPSCKYQVPFPMWHLARTSFRARHGHLMCVLNSFMDTVMVVIIFFSTEIWNPGWPQVNPWTHPQTAIPLLHSSNSSGVSSTPTQLFRIQHAVRA